MTTRAMVTFSVPLQIAEGVDPRAVEQAGLAVLLSVGAADSADVDADFDVALPDGMMMEAEPFVVTTYFEPDGTPIGPLSDEAADQLVDDFFRQMNDEANFDRDIELNPDDFDNYEDDE